MHWIIMGLLSLLLGACSSDDSELKRYINMIKTRPARPIEPIPEFQPLKKFIYPEKDNRRSPFKPVVAEQEESFAPNIKRPKQPLEAFPLDALNFVGILKEGPMLWALISQPGGFVSRVKPGDYMGQNYGQILSIQDKAIQLEETLNVNGKWEKKTTTLTLRAPK
jgi:type IV pilus assembly protein PilP